MQGCDAGTIRTRSRPCCCLCGEQGGLLYQGLTDRLFGVPGGWDMRRCANPDCHLVWLDPMPIEEDVVRLYRNYLVRPGPGSSRETRARRLYRLTGECYLESHYGYSTGRSKAWKAALGTVVYLLPVRRAGLDFGVMFLPARPGGRLLEVGCGCGRMLKAMQDLGWRVEGVDIDPGAVKSAQEKGLTVRQGNLADQGYPDDAFDAVAMIHLIEHASDPVALLRECRRVLKPGGVLVVVTPNANSWGHRMYGPDWRGLEPPRHFHIFNARTLTEAIAQGGFDGGTCRSALLTRGILPASRLLRRFGNVEAAVRPSATLRLWTEAVEVAAWLRLQVDREAGEELILSARK